MHNRACSKYVEYTPSSRAVHAPAWLSRGRQSQCSYSWLPRISGTSSVSTILFHCPNGIGNPRKFKVAGVLTVAATEPSSLCQHLANMNVSVDTRMGQVTIRAMQPTDALGACVVLCRGFAGTPEEISLNDARKYFETVVNDPPNGVLFVARIQPHDITLLPPNQESRLIGTVALSLHEDTLQQSPTLPPPPDTAYLSNMSVDTRFRRLGVARALMRVCDEAARAAGMTEIYLHVRQGDEAAYNLYTTAGYVEVARDTFLSAKLKNVSPRILLRKTLLG